MRKIYNLHKTRIYIINTILKNNNYLKTNTAYILQYSNIRIY